MSLAIPQRKVFLIACSLRFRGSGSPRFAGVTRVGGAGRWTRYSRAKLALSLPKGGNPGTWDMRHLRRITRRKFIQVTTAAAAGSMVGCAYKRSPCRFFTIEEGQTVAAICERIIPADQDPGATEAGVVNFIDLQLMGPYKRYHASYRQGIRGVEKASLKMFGHRFTELGPERQDEVLKELERVAAAEKTRKGVSSAGESREGVSPAGETRKGQSKGQSSEDFFPLILSHTMQGFYGDPRHGGNRGRVSWKMLGLPYPPIRGRLHYDLTKPVRS